MLSVVVGEVFCCRGPKTVERGAHWGIFNSLVIMKIAPLPIKSSGNDGAIVAGSALSASQRARGSSLVLV